MTSQLPRSREEAGAVAVLVALLSTVLFIVCGLVVDLGQARMEKRQAQNTTDSSSLAAGTALYLSGTATPDVPGAVAAVKSYAANNYGVTDAEWAACTDPGALPYQPAGTSCISFDDDTPLTVRVVTPVRRTKMAFGTMIGTDHVDIRATSQAELTPGGKSKCGLCIVGEGYHDLQNGNATISGGDVAINGDVNVHSNGLVSTDGQISVEGDAQGPLTSYTPDPIEGQQPVTDPLANIMLPSYTGLPVKSDPCGPDSTHGPGIYGDWNFPNSTCTLQPGLYVITGQWSFSGQAALDASAGVTLYFVCGTTSAPRACNAPGEQGGWLDATGNGAMQIVAPSTGPTAGLAVVYDRLNTQMLRLTGNAGTMYQGTIYALSATLDYRGNGCGTPYDALIVVQNMGFSGTNACLESQYTQEHNVYVPPSALHLSK